MMGKPCMLCGGTLGLLGTLGMLRWLRCLNCGMVVSRKVRNKPKRGTRGKA